MKISMKGQYALRLMLDLAIHHTGEYIRLKSIAKRQDLPEKYMEQIIMVLLKAKYVKSIRGSKGGYQLSWEPEKYTVGMILRTVEGSLAPVDCLEEENECSQRGICVTYDVWKELNQAICNVLDGVTLGDLVKRQEEKMGNDYVI